MVTLVPECPTGGWDTLHGEPLIYSEGLYSVELNLGLQEWEVNEAWQIIRWLKGSGPFLGIAANIIVSGPPRQGKGLFSNTLAWKIKRYFKGKRVLRDDHPAPLFGEYTFFNEDTVLSNVKQMGEVAEKQPKNDKALKGAKLITAVDQWSTDKGAVMMQNSIILKDEFWKDVDRRRGMSTMTLLFSGFMKTYAHIDMLLLGIVQSPNDLDRLRILPWVNLHIKCIWCGDAMPDTTQVSIYHVRWSSGRQKLVPVPPTTKRPIVLYVNGGRPRAELGGQRYYDLFRSKAAPDLRSITRRG